MDPDYFIHFSSLGKIKSAIPHTTIVLINHETKKALNKFYPLSFCKCLAIYFYKTVRFHKNINGYEIYEAREYLVVQNS